MNLRWRVGTALLSAVEAEGLREHGELHAVGGADLVENPSEVMLDRLFANGEFAGNLPVRVACDHPRQHFALTARERGTRNRPRPRRDQAANTFKQLRHERLA